MFHFKTGDFKDMRVAIEIKVIGLVNLTPVFLFVGSRRGFRAETQGL